VELEVSYDDGASWHPAAMDGKAGSWSTRIKAPRTARFVTLHTTVRDSKGNSVEQRIDRAFGLR
jgi:hypothetical protein